MRQSWMAGFSILFIGGMLISLTIEGQYLGSDVTNVFYRVMNPNFASYTNPLLAVGGFFIWAWAFIQALWAIIIWDYSFLTGSWEILRYFGWALSTSMAVALVLAMRGTGSS